MSPDSQVRRIVNNHTKVLTIEPSANVARATEIMTEKNVGCLVVCDENEKVVGIFTERDALTKVLSKKLDPETTTIEDVMVTRVICCRMDTAITTAQQVMSKYTIRHLPIIDDGELQGLISSRDILAYQLSSVEAVVRLQSRTLNSLETKYPGITQLKKDTTGRIVI